MVDKWHEAAALWAAFGRGENRRVPVRFACDEQLWLKVSGHTFREFYTDPGVHLKTQLDGIRWFSRNVPGDMPLPRQWDVAVQLWMAENAFFGCDVVYQEDDYAWAKPLPLSRDELLHYLGDLDPEERVRNGQAFRMYEALRDLADGMVFDGLPVNIVRPGGNTHGIFTKAAEIRGLEQICTDIYDAPDFVEKLLQVVTVKAIGRMKAWHRLVTGCELQIPSEAGFHFCDDSLQMISAETYERFVLPCHERLYSEMTRGRRRLHLCGRAAQHFETLRWKLNVTSIDGPGPFVDHGRYLETLGPDFRIDAQTDHSVLEKGSKTEIQAMMRQLLTPRARLPGRYQILGYVTRETPMSNVQACYQAGLEYGVIPE